MPIAYGQNATELGRNIIDLEQLKNARDAQQAQAQNQFLAQLNQARLGQQQIAAQSQAQQNALMMQALQQRQQQGNLDRDFGLRQTAQGNQVQQFADQLKLEQERLNRPQYFPGMLTEAEKENNRRSMRNQEAKGIAAKAQFALGLLMKEYADKQAKNKASWFGGNPKKDFDEYTKKVNELISGFGDYRDVLNIVTDPTDPFKTRFEPIIMPSIEMPGIGRGAGSSPIPANQPTNPTIGPLPIILPGIGSTRTLVPVAPVPQAQRFDWQSYNPFGNYNVGLTNAPRKLMNRDFDPLPNY